MRNAEWKMKNRCTLLFLIDLLKCQHLFFLCWLFPMSVDNKHNNKLIFSFYQTIFVLYDEKGKNKFYGEKLHFIESYVCIGLQQTSEKTMKKTFLFGAYFVSYQQFCFHHGQRR